MTSPTDQIKSRIDAYYDGGGVKGEDMAFTVIDGDRYSYITFVNGWVKREGTAAPVVERDLAEMQIRAFIERFPDPNQTVHWRKYPHNYEQDGKVYSRLRAVAVPCDR